MMINKEKNFVSAIIYLNNNEKTIADFIVGLDSVLNANFEKYEIICVNDASGDGSVKAVESVSDKLGNCMLSVVNMSYYQGLELSMNAGLDLSIGDFVFEFDSCLADYSWDTVMKVYFHSLKGYDIVSAGNGKYHRASSKLFYTIFNRSANLQYNLESDAFRIISRRAINRVHAMSKTIPYRKALYANCGLKSAVLHYDPISSVNIRPAGDRSSTAASALILFTDVAYKFSVAMTLLMMLATLGVGIYTIVIFALKQPVAGFTTIMLVMTGSFFGVFAILAIVTKYLSILVDLVFKRQQYIIESVNKITK